MKKISLLISLFILISLSSKAQIPKLQSIFIYNFTKYIEWPASYKSGDFTIGVIGQTPLTKELNNLAKSKKAGSQTISIKKFNKVSEIDKCNILFIPKNKSNELSNILNKLNGKSTLIITEKKGMAKQGAGINFVIVNNKQKFELNKANITKYKLKISPSLINLAIIIK
ncbi:MAG: YfiR family protein [Bacteroidetes bacterium]|nr:MAG: YfiR family protein [Bacteroidota bacterium]